MECLPSAADGPPADALASADLVTASHPIATVSVQATLDGQTRACPALSDVSLASALGCAQAAVPQRLEAVFTAQQHRLNQLQRALLSHVEHLTGTAEPSLPPSSTPSGACGDDDSTTKGSRDVRALQAALGPPLAAGRLDATTATTPVIVLDITSLYSARGVGRPVGAGVGSAPSRRQHVGVQTDREENAMTDLSASPTTLAFTNAADGAETVENLRAALAAAQSRSLFQQASLVRMSKELAKMQETIKLLGQDGDDWLEREAYQRSGSPAYAASPAATTDAGAVLLESAKDRELRRLRTLMRFSELKKDSDLLPDAYNHLDSALKEMAALRREQAKARVKQEEARQCVRAVAGCMLELQDLVPCFRDGDAGATVRDRLAYVLERCRDVDATIPAPPPTPDGATEAGDVTKPHRARRHDDRARTRPPRAGHTLDPTLPSSAAAQSRSRRSLDPSHAAHLTSAAAALEEVAAGEASTPVARQPLSRRHSAASYVRVQEAVAHARRASSCRPNAAHGPLPSPSSVPERETDREATREATSALQQARARGRPPTPGAHRSVPLHDTTHVSGKRPSVPSGGSLSLFRANSLRGGEKWI